MLTVINFKAGIVLSKGWYYSQTGIVLSLVFSSFKIGISEVIILAVKFPFPSCNHITPSHPV